jgi:hypothetical protein
MLAHQLGYGAVPAMAAVDVNPPQFAAASHQCRRIQSGTSMASQAATHPNKPERARDGRRYITKRGWRRDTGTRAASVGRLCPPLPNAAGRRSGLFIRSGVGRAATEGGICRRASLRRQAARRPRRKAILVASGSQRKKRPPYRGNTSVRRAANPAPFLVTRCLDVSQAQRNSLIIWRLSDSDSKGNLQTLRDFLAPP